MRKKVKNTKKSNTSQNMQTKEDGTEKKENETETEREIEIALTMINPLMLSYLNILNEKMGWGGLVNGFKEDYR